MQNRGLIKFFAIIFALVCVYQLSFTFVANSIVSDAKAFAKLFPHAKVDEKLLFRGMKKIIKKANLC